ncbi:MAG: hypothetical protein J0H83_08615 [Candidatus Melainabacteria bacterium]|nr:hypothetical protein [Candidatus Melainabacteria bacterium]
MTEVAKPKDEAKDKSPEKKGEGTAASENDKASHKALDDAHGKPPGAKVEAKSDDKASDTKHDAAGEKKPEDKSLDKSGDKPGDKKPGDKANEKAGEDGDSFTSYWLKNSMLAYQKSTDEFRKLFGWDDKPKESDAKSLDFSPQIYGGSVETKPTVLDQLKAMDKPADAAKPAEPASSSYDWSWTNIAKTVGDTASSISDSISKTTSSIVDSIFAKAGDPLRAALDGSIEKDLGNSGSVRVATEAEKTAALCSWQNDRKEIKSIMQDGSTFKSEQGNEMKFGNDGSFVFKNKDYLGFGDADGTQRLYDKVNDAAYTMNPDKTITKYDRKTNEMVFIDPKSEQARVLGDVFNTYTEGKTNLATVMNNGRVDHMKVGESLRVGDAQILALSETVRAWTDDKDPNKVMMKDLRSGYEVAADLKADKVRVTGPDGRSKEMTVAEFNKNWSERHMFAKSSLDRARNRLNFEYEHEGPDGKRNHCKGFFGRNRENNGNILEGSVLDQNGKVTKTVVNETRNDLISTTVTKDANGNVLGSNTINPNDGEHFYQAKDADGKIIDNYNIDTNTFQNYDQGWSLSSDGMSFEDGNVYMSTDGTVTSGGKVIHDSSAATYQTSNTMAAQASAAASQAQSIVDSVMGNPAMLNGSHLSILHNAHALCSTALGVSIAAGNGAGVMSSLSSMGAIEGQMSRVGQAMTVRESLYSQGVVSNEGLINQCMRNVDNGGNIAKVVEDAVYNDQPWRAPDYLSNMMAKKMAS